MDKAKFDAFNEAHPEFYQRFEEVCLKLIANGRDHYSAMAILDFIRMETDLSGQDVEVFKCNNNYRKGWALMFELRHPEHKGFFTFRSPAQQVWNWRANATTH